MGARLLAIAIFLICCCIVFWYALVWAVHRGTQSVPDLQGKTPEEAERVTHDLGLTIDVDQPGVFSATYPPGTIASQEPYPGYHLKSGASVRVWISRGAERATIPDLTGQTLEGARRDLETVGLALGGQARVRGHGRGDSVVASEPPSGAVVPPGSAVRLLVNTAPDQELWVMPSLLAQPLSSVRAFCQHNRLRLGQIHDVTYPGVPSGTVLRQYPAAGSPLSRSDIIAVWVSQ